MIAPLFARAHRLQKAMRHLNQRTHIQIDHVEFAVEIMRSEISHRSESGVIDQQINFEFAFWVSSNNRAGDSGFDKSIATY